MESGQHRGRARLRSGTDNVNAMWDETDALQSQMAEWFPHGIQTTETRLSDGTEETEDLLDAACAALIEWVD